MPCLNEAEALEVCLRKAHGLLPGKTEELQFYLPPDAPSTSLSEGKTVFWELAVELDRAGLDFNEIYLVPVYRAD